MRQHVSGHLSNALNNPVKFIFPNNGGIAFGFEATILVDLCVAVMAARSAGLLRENQLPIAANCEIVVVATAKVGIEALVDEVTGFQAFREASALQQSLGTFISEELRKWIPTFRVELFQEMCRLRGVPFKMDMRLPQYFGHLINDVIYSRLAPGVLRALRRRVCHGGNKRARLHQWLTENEGYPKLMTHIDVVIALMTVSRTWPEFVHNLNRARPPYTVEQSLFDMIPGY